MTTPQLKAKACYALGILALATISSAAFAQTTHQVPGDFPTISAAMSSPSVVAGDTVRVAPGVFTETFAVKAGVTLEGSGIDQTILRPNIRNTSITLASNSTVTALTVTSSNAVSSLLTILTEAQRNASATVTVTDDVTIGLRATIGMATNVGATGVTVDGVRFVNNNTALYVNPGSQNLRVVNCTFEFNRNALAFDAEAANNTHSGAVVTNNFFLLNDQSGITLRIWGANAVASNFNISENHIRVPGISSSLGRSGVNYRVSPTANGLVNTAALPIDFSGNAWSFAGLPSTVPTNSIAWVPTAFFRFSISGNGPRLVNNWIIAADGFGATDDVDGISTNGFQSTQTVSYNTSAPRTAPFLQNAIASAPKGWTVEQPVGVNPEPNTLISNDVIVTRQDDSIIFNTGNDPKFIVEDGGSLSLLGIEIDANNDAIIVENGGTLILLEDNRISGSITNEGPDSSVIIGGVIPNSLAGPDSTLFAKTSTFGCNNIASSINIGSGNLTVLAGEVLCLTGDLTKDPSGTLSAAVGSVINFDGSTGQQIVGNYTGSNAFDTLEINNTSPSFPSVGVVATSKIEARAGVLINRGFLGANGGLISDGTVETINNTARLRLNEVSEFRGDFVMNGQFAALALAEVFFNGSAPQTISGLPLTSTRTFRRLTFNNPAGVTAQTPVQAAVSLELTSGIVTAPTGSYIRVSAPNAPVTVGTGYVAGEFRATVTGSTNQPRLFPVGDANGYTPLRLVFAPGLSGNGDVVVSTVGLTHPTVLAEGTNIDQALERFWRVSTIETVPYAGINYSAQATFLSSDVPAGGNSANYRLALLNSPTQLFTTFNTVLAGNAALGSPITRFSDITLLEQDPNDPLAVDLIAFDAILNGDNSVTLSWETATEIDNAGFNVFRGVRSGGGFVKGARLNASLIAPLGSEISGATYSLVDPVLLTPGETRAYFLEDVDLNGTITTHGPAVVSLASGSDIAINDSVIDTLTDLTAAAWTFWANDSLSAVPAGTDSEGLSIILPENADLSIGGYATWLTANSFPPLPAGSYRITASVNFSGKAEGTAFPTFRLNAFEDTFARAFHAIAEDVDTDAAGNLSTVFVSNGSSPWRLAIELLAFREGLSGGFTVTGLTIEKLD